MLLILYLLYVVLLANSSSVKSFNSNNTNTHSHRVDRVNKKHHHNGHSFPHNTMTNHTNSKKLLLKMMGNNSNFYNLEYYDCSKYPDDKNFSKISSNLFMVSSKTSLNQKRKKDYSFTVITDVIVLPEQKYDFDVQKLFAKGYKDIVIKEESGISKSSLVYSYSDEFDVESRNLSDLIDIAFVFYDDKSVVDIIDIINSWEHVVQDYNVIFISNKLANKTNKIPIPNWIRQYEIYSSSDIEKVIKPYFLDLRLYAYWTSKKKYLFMIGDKKCPYISLSKYILKKIVPKLLLDLSLKTIPFEGHSEEKLETIAVIPMFSRSSGFITEKNNLTNNNYALVLPNKIRYDLPLNQPIAFHRESIGALLLYFTPLKSDSKENKRLICNSKLSLNCEDVITGWILQIMTEVSPYNIKVGLPSLSSSISKDIPNYEWIIENNIQDDICSNSITVTNNKTGLPDWYCEARQFFLNYKYSGCRRYHVARRDNKKYCMWSAHGDVSQECLFVILADAIIQNLGKYSFFENISNQIYSWVTVDNSVWELRMAFLGNIYPISSRNSIIDKSSKELKCAVLTISHNEKELLPRWVNYYSKYFDHRDVFIFDHLTSDGSIDKVKSSFPNINYIKLVGSQYKMPIWYRSNIVELYQDMLLRYGYKCVLFSDVDEIIAANPVKYPKGLSQYLDKFINNSKLNVIKVNAYELAHIAYGNGTKGTEEPPLDWSKSILSQRQYYSPDQLYNKPLLTKIPLKYRPGFHKLFDIHLLKTIPVDEDLVMFHIRSMDFDFCNKQAIYKFNLSQEMNPREKASGYADHWNQFHKLQRLGELCQFANGCYIGPNKNVTHYDNTGIYPLTKLEEYWKSVYI